MRSVQNHRLHCELIDTEGLEDNFSKQFGVNRNSIINTIPHFNVCVCLPHDIMHIILEGVLPKHIKLLLKHCIVDMKFFNLAYLNSSISNFPFSKNEKLNSPRPIDREKLMADGDKITQSGKEKILLLLSK